MSPRPNVSEERKGQILQAAITVFAQIGFHQARMEDIAQRAGLSKSAVYLYFENKDAVIAALLTSFLEQELGKLQEWVSSKPEESVSEQLILITRELAADVTGMPGILSINYEFYAVANHREEVRVALREYYHTCFELFAALIQQGMNQGEFRSGDAGEAATSLVALYEGLCLLWFLNPQTMQLERTSEAAVRLLLAGLTERAENQPSP